MIVPVVEDEEWLQHFQSLPELSLPRLPVLMVVPHPDDETLGAGALLATLSRERIPVTVIAATDGENAYDTDEEERCRLRITREREQTAALDVLGVAGEQIHRLRLPDSGVSQVEEQLQQEILRIVTGDMLVLAPWTGDFHPDHEACGRAARSAAVLMNLPIMFYFFWTWHRSRPAFLDSQSLRAFRPDAEARATKLEALSMHQSQLHRHGDEPILPHRLLYPAHWPFEVYLV